MDNKEILNDKNFLLSSLTKEDNEEDDEEKNVEIIFRNYIPQDRNLKIEKCYKTSEVKSIEDKIKANVLKSVKEFLSLEKNSKFMNPVKRDFDLKRNITQKMNYLNNLTIESLKEMANNNGS